MCCKKSGMIPFFKKSDIYNDFTLSNQTNLNFRKKISDYFLNQLAHENFFLTKSCTQSLEIAFMTINAAIGSEVILPSYGFVSIANAIALRGLKCVFVDCEPNTMNIDTHAALNAITPKTVAIVTINYAGVACDYDKLIPVCKERGILLIEDNAHGIRAKYKDRYLGTLGDISTISFDFLKNVSCDEGGGISINKSSLISDFENVYHFGTNKASFLRGETSFYEWKSLGTNSMLAEPLCKILYGQLMASESIISGFLEKWHMYYNSLQHLKSKGIIELTIIPEYSQPNGHMFWIKVSDSDERSKIIKFLAQKEISTAFHYTPLHQSEFGKKNGMFYGNDIYTTKESSRLLRLPLYNSLTEIELEKVVSSIDEFYKK